MPQDTIIPPSDIPDLSSLRAQTEWAALLRFFVGGGSSDAVTHALFVNAVRLHDAAIQEYGLGRQAILGFHSCAPDQFGISYIAQATTHFESCIWHFERFIKHARALRSLKSAEIELKAIIPRDLSFLNQSVEHQITQLRHTLAHLEGAALRGQLPQGTSVSLMPLEHGLSISNHVILWSDLAQWLCDAHACIKKLAGFKSSPPEEGA
ncbi:hypothetical protein [Rhodanobacter glycinis]|uniref:Uncharacterized protein n=1 Tax=Rhodanobacter glycinis TaxID=582702 RepID=A0A1I3ZLY6_9GAMM|nr:hypothetical protein [Rhodanobacter glycinis]SFK45055.1 hypothetical protein SAMN05192579_10310 [Rhodanobacter glycinis]